METRNDSLGIQDYPSRVEEKAAVFSKLGGYTDYYTLRNSRMGSTVADYTRLGDRRI